jgi:accessory colonization factor AcfC
MKPFALFLLLSVSSQYAFSQQDTIFVYGPGGPYAAIHEAAVLFDKENNVTISITKGPVSEWKYSAELNADLIYSGSESMMTNFSNDFNIIQKETITPLYLRKSGLLVRPGNPKKIRQFSDILMPGVNILVVNGAGLTGVWEDMIGKSHDIDSVRMLRKNIVSFAGNSGVARAEWIQNKNIDVWITWNIWQVANSELAEFIPVSEAYTIYRDCGIALTKNASGKQKAQDFYEFLKSKEVKIIFKKWGWLTEAF